MSIPIIDVQPRPSLGAAFGQAAGTGLAKLVMQHRNEKIGEQVGAPKGFFGLFDDPAEASKAWSQVRQAKLMQDLLAPQQEMGARQDMGVGQEPQMGARDEMMAPKPKGILEGGVTPRHLIAASGTPLEQPLRTMYETQERKAAKRESQAEPQLLETENRLRHLEQSEMRFSRLGELFSPDLEQKFPSNLSVAMFTKDGELRPTAQALLSPEAQESIKLISDELSGAKDTFGARVTNFDLQSYMKRLPTLLNSAEGRRRVLRDLQIMNQISKEHDEGILNIMDRSGGAGSIPLSKAERIYRQENKQRLSELRSEFLNPNKKEFSDIPDASRYSGKRIKDESTGQVFRSNGKEWIPEK